MSLQFSLNRFPQNGSIKDKSGLPWGCIVQPFVPPEKVPVSATKVNAEKITRCSECFAYINAFAKFTRFGWVCPLCQTTNECTKRYNSPTKRKQLPELQLGVLEFDVPNFEEGEVNPTQPVFIAVVDVTGSYDSVELIKSGLQGALQGKATCLTASDQSLALPPTSLFGLVTVSDRIGIHDLRSPVPHIKHVIIPETGPCSLSLDDVVRMDNFLVDLQTNMNNISAAIDNLKSLEDALISTNLLRGFGTTISFLFDFLELYEQSISNVRLITFLCGIPNFGDGALKEPTKEDDDPLSPQTAFYKNQAERAARCGACVDLFVVTNTHVGLPSIKFLTLTTGGNIMIYDQPENAILPQDIYRQFSRPQASHALLRIRCSKEFKPSNSFGHFYPDPNYDNLYHVEGCDQFKTFAFDFEFSDAGGFVEEPPTIQMAFAYTYLPSLSDDDRNCIRRRLRVNTVQLGVARDRKQLYADADPNVVLCLLAHKLIRASLDEGQTEGRLLLQDWLTILLTHYNEQLDQESKKSKANKPAEILPPQQPQSPSEIDLSFSKIPNLKRLSRSVFALLNSPLMRTENIDSDYVIYLQCLYSGLEPQFLHRALYPELSSYGAPNNLSCQGLPLAKSSVLSSGCRLFLLDAFTSIYVYYLGGGPEGEIPFPPPKGSLIRKTIDLWKQERHITPKVVMTKAGGQEEYLFLKMLIEEGVDGGQSFQDFINVVTREVSTLRSSG